LNATEVIAEFRAKKNIYRTQADLEKVDSGSSSSESDDDDAKAKNKRAKKAAGHQLTAEILLNIPAEPREGTLPILQCTEAMQLDTLPQATLKRLQKMVPIIKLLPVPPKENHLIAFLRSAGFNRDDLDTNICARPAASQLNNIHNACILLTHGIGNTLPGKLPSLLAIFALAVSTAPLANCRRRRLDTPQEALQHAIRNLQSQRTKLALTLRGEGSVKCGSAGEDVPPSSCSSSAPPAPTHVASKAAGHYKITSLPRKPPDATTTSMPVLAGDGLI
jgi:hypothetical protein